MAITWDDVVAIAPELSTVSVEMQNALIAYVEEEISSTTWGARAARGKVYLAAHLATMSARVGSAGPVTSETVGSVSRSYAVDASSAPSGSTSYGAEYERLVMTLGAARFLVV